MNIKLRDRDLKIKSLHYKTDTGMALKLEIKEREVEDGKQLLSILCHASTPINVICVHKQRELHIWPPGSTDAVTIELAKISKPEFVTTASIEHRSLEK